VTRQTTDGLFAVIAEQEKQIRSNPAARMTDLRRRCSANASFRDWTIVLGPKQACSFTWNLRRRLQLGDAQIYYVAGKTMKLDKNSAPDGGALTPWTAAQCRQLVDDLRPARLRVYVFDVAACALAGWLALAAAYAVPHPLAAVLLLLVASLLLYRGLAFIHELFHQQSLRGLRLAWHAMVGIPLLLPLLVYLPIHQAHHSAQSYGTSRDGEYEHFRGRRTWMIVRLLLLNLTLPLVLLIRFGLLTPLGHVVPVVRRQVIPSFIHLSLRVPFKAAELRGPLAAESRWIELGCMAWAWLLVAGLVAGHWPAVGLWALTLVIIATLNTVRAVCSTHLYVEMDSGRDTLGQIADSLNIDSNGWLTKLLFPVGFQFHALHHLAPYLPYHALPEAHRRLMARLPPGSLYHQVTVRSPREGWQRVVDATSVKADAVATSSAST